MMNSKFVSVFTPTYNRKNELAKLYSSLCQQSSKNFEWLIVDDGSSDDSDKYIANLKPEGFKIRYYKQKNGGKHTAINRGVCEAEGTVFAIVDSDDYLVPNAIAKIEEWFNEIKGMNQFAGVASQKADLNEQSVGTFYSKDFVDALSSERHRLHIEGDKFEIFYTAVLKKFPFPIIENEKFLSEAVVWNRIAKAGLKIRWHKEALYICEYLANGLSDQKDRLVKNSPLGYAMYIRELRENGIPLKSLLGYYSYYAKIRKEQHNIAEIAQELQCRKMVLRTSIILRKLVYLIKKENL